MKYEMLDLLKAELTSFEQRRKALSSYKETDVRRDFFAFMQAVLGDYYQKMIVTSLCKEINEHTVSFKEEAKVR